MESTIITAARLVLRIVSHHATKFGGYRSCGQGENAVLSRELTRPRNQKVVWLYRWVHLTKITTLPDLVTIPLEEGKILPFLFITWRRVIRGWIIYSSKITILQVLCHFFWKNILTPRGLCWPVTCVTSQSIVS